MRVLYVAPRFHTNQIPIMEGWKEHGDAVCFIAHHAGQNEDYSAVRPIVLGYSGWFLLAERLYLFLFRKRENAVDFRLRHGFPPIRRLRRLIREFAPDLVITRERSVYSICVTEICRRFGFPVILYNQSPLWEKKEDGFRLGHRLVSRLTPRFRITPVYSLGRSLEGKRPDPEACYLPFLMPPHLAPDERSYFRDGRIHIFAIGKYQERKNHRMLLEIIGELKKKYPVRLAIAGEISNRFHQEYYDGLVRYVKEHGLEDLVELYVNVNRQKIFELYSASDLFVLASTAEPAAVSHLEAMSFSLPVISGEDNGTAGYIEEGCNGYICRDNDKADLKEKIEFIISDPERLEKMGAESYRLVLERHQFDGYYKQIMRILEQIKQEKS